MRGSREQPREGLGTSSSRGCALLTHQINGAGSSHHLPQVTKLPTRVQATHLRRTQNRTTPEPRKLIKLTGTDSSSCNLYEQKHALTTHQFTQRGSRESYWAERQVPAVRPVPAWAGGVPTVTA